MTRLIKPPGGSITLFTRAKGIGSVRPRPGTSQETSAHPCTCGRPESGQWRWPSPQRNLSLFVGMNQLHAHAANGVGTHVVVLARVLLAPVSPRTGLPYVIAELFI